MSLLPPWVFIEIDHERVDEEPCVDVENRVEPVVLVGSLYVVGIAEQQPCPVPAVSSGRFGAVADVAPPDAAIWRVQPHPDQFPIAAAL